MKQWVQKLIEQLDYDFTGQKNGQKNSQKNGQGPGEKAKLPKLSEERATLLYMIDVYNKHLIDLDTHPVRRVREQLDAFTREIVSGEKAELEKSLFRFRQYFSSYRVAEYTYIRKTFEDFKGIVWNFVEHLSEDFHLEETEDKEITMSLEQLKEAVDTDSIDLLRTKSREFIHNFHEHQAKRESRRTKRMKGIRKNLDDVKKQLVEADHNLKVDHLTQAFNRRSFDEQVRENSALFQFEKTPVSLVIIDIDHFKKINDTFGHDVGDFVLKELVQMLQQVFDQAGDFVARMGGEEFAVLLPGHSSIHAVKRAEDAMARIRKEVFVQQGQELRFTVSMGIAQLCDGEPADSWIKRADQALYFAKNSGRNRYSVAEPVVASRVA